MVHKCPDPFRSAHPWYGQSCEGCGGMYQISIHAHIARRNRALRIVSIRSRTGEMNVVMCTLRSAARLVRRECHLSIHAPSSLSNLPMQAFRSTPPDCIKKDPFQPIRANGGALLYLWLALRARLFQSTVGTLGGQGRQVRLAAISIHDCVRSDRPGDPIQKSTVESWLFRSTP